MAYLTKAERKEVEALESEDTKWCKKCKVIKPLCMFNFNATGRKFTDILCIDCAKEKSKERQIEKFGITLKKYNKMLEKQGNKCKICRTHVPGGNGRWSIDHDHATGAVRGLVCQTCNGSLGFAQDNIKILALAISYLESTKEKVLDIVQSKQCIKIAPHLPIKQQKRLEDIDTKYCVGCGKIKQLYKFSIKAGSRKFANSYCLECERERKIFRKFGITLSQYHALLKLQNSSCAICGSKNTKNKRNINMCIDHDHKTGDVRGLLCALCNLLLGYAKDDVKILASMIQYLNESRS